MGNEAGLKVVDIRTSAAAAAVEVPEVVAIMVFADDVFVVVVGTESGNEKCLHRSSSTPGGDVVVVDRIRLLADGGG